MRAVVLVGGFGTRLRPLTNDLPKQMLPVVRVPMIERVVAALGSYGVTEAVLSLGYRPDAFIDAYPDGVCAGSSFITPLNPSRSILRVLFALPPCRLGLTTRSLS